MQFIETDELKGTVKPTEAENIISKDQFGIDAILEGYIIQNVNISKSRSIDDTYDQKGALISQLDYDERWDGSMTVIGPSNEDCDLEGLAVGDTTFTFNNKRWKITSCTYQGTYSDKKTYSLTFFRTTNFPAQS